MKHSLTWRAIAIVFVLAMAVLSAYPLEEKIRLGLDLQGGMHMLLHVKTDDALRSETDKDMERMRQQMQEEGLSTVTVTRTGDTQFTMNGVPRDRDDAVKEQAEKYLSGWAWNRSGEELRFSMEIFYREQLKSQAVAQAEQTIRNRVDAYGVSEPLISRQGGGGDDRLVVQLPGVDDPDRIRELIQSTAFLEFRFAHPSVGPQESREALFGAFGGSLPPDYEIFPQIVRDSLMQEVGRNYWPIETRRVITGRELRTARGAGDQFGKPVVIFDLTPEGGDIFGAATSENVGRNLAIILDGVVQSAPVINERISDTGQISGSFTREEVDDLSLVLRSGALPAGIEYLEERTVRPSLGRDSINKGVRAITIGSLLVVLMMVVVYRFSGLNAVLALTLNVVLVLGALAGLGATLTLPGLAGIVLVIGMAVDANVLIFERIREELRSGRTVKSAVDSGFSKALSTILDANFTTLIAALFLFQFGTGPIRGFAVTLSIGILASLFTAVFVSRFIFDLVLSRRERVERLSI